eukprot:1140866-Pelagomonas_calceolata.AAC.1
MASIWGGATVELAEQGVKGQRVCFYLPNRVVAVRDGHIAAAVRRSGQCNVVCHSRQYNATCWSGQCDAARWGRQCNAVCLSKQCDAAR